MLGPAAPEVLPDDEPMPIPSTWRQPASHDEDRWYSQQLGATLMGLFAGLAIVVPAVLWLSGWIGPLKTKTGTTGPTTTASMDVRPIERRPEAKPVERKPEAKPQPRPVDTAAASQYVTGSVEPRGSFEIRKPETSGSVPVAVPVPPPQPTPPPAPRADDQRARMDELIARRCELEGRRPGRPRDA